ncbi:hypothetical protein ACIPY3_19255 [Paenarthrobacter sp. NPDC089714]|uniref:hypothetical protein n=1 Tax=Paenarthrobacter sp. NPDC089714 TaxID=3364377 RepID=UPI003813FB2C
MDTSSELLAIAIGKVIGGGRGVPYEAVSLCQINGRVEQYSIAVSPAAFTWSATRMPDGGTDSFDPNTLTIRAADGHDRVLTLDRVPRLFPESVQLAFPLSLPIWGRHMDQYHPVAAEDRGTYTTLLLRHREDPTIFGSFTFETRSGVGTSLVLPTYALKLEREPEPEPGEHDFGFVSGHKP